MALRHAYGERFHSGVPGSPDLPAPQQWRPILQQHGVDTAAAALLVSYPDLVRAELGIPADLSILMGVALGYRDERHPLNQHHSPRRPLREVVRFRDVA